MNTFSIKLPLDKAGIYIDALQTAINALENDELRTYIGDLFEIRDAIEVVTKVRS